MVRHIISFTYSLVLGVLISSLIGLPAVARASGPCDTANYERFIVAPDNTSTYAITKDTMSWTSADALAKSSKGQLVNIKNAESNTSVFSNFSSSFTPVFADLGSSAPATPPGAAKTGKAWIGAYDPMNSAVWCVEGGACTPVPDRFQLTDGTSLGGYNSWAPGQPDGFCTASELAFSRDGTCDGEPWVAIGKDGKWSDEGNHGVYPGVALKAIVEWPGNVLDCAIVPGKTRDGQPPDELLPGAEEGKQYCNKNQEPILRLCLDTSVAGAKLCPTDKAKCEPRLDPRVCPSGTAPSGGSSCSGAGIGRCPIGEPTGSGLCYYTYNCTPLDPPDAPFRICFGFAQMEYTCGPRTTLSGTMCYGEMYCQQGTYIPEKDACYYNKQICPTSASAACMQMNGDSEVVAPGVPVMWCSPYNCQNDTKGYMTSSDTDAGLNDPKDDGLETGDGQCLDSVYIFSGTDSRCRVYDNRGMVSSYAKIVIAIALAATGVGAVLAGALAATMAGTLGATVAQAVATTIVNSAITLATNAAVDAATGQPQTTLMGALMVFAMNAVAASINTPPSTNVGDTTRSVVNGSEVSMTAERSIDGVRNIDAVSGSADGDLIANRTLGMTRVDTGRAGVVEWVSPGTQNADGSFSGAMVRAQQQIGGSWVITSFSTSMKALSPLQSYLSQATQLMEQYAPAIETGMLGSYSSTKCCSPDKMSSSCEKAEFAMYPQVKAKQCHKIGEYCATKFLGLCMVQKASYCCFNSVLARIFQEQGRPGLKTFGDDSWGSPKAPNCRGFTPEEFQALDFDSMDMSEYTEDLERRMNTELSPLLKDYLSTVGTETEEKMKTVPGADGNAIGN